VIPLAARTILGIRPGQRLQVLVYQNQLRLVPVRPLRELRGSLPGVGTDIERDEDRV
jgi:bifunctional DNA-binding transcriptional regulator/antitoxin component of YhaV-PrlF toxin-antitoxin module